jgi:poly(3-hydroxybutyrate) depolymerase
VARDLLFAACNAVPLAVACVASLQIDQAATTCGRCLPCLEHNGNHGFHKMPLAR